MTHSLIQDDSDSKKLTKGDLVLSAVLRMKATGLV